MKKNYKLITASVIVAFTNSSMKAQCPIPSLVTASPSTICAGATTSLNATATGATVYWFTVPVGGVAIGTSSSAANFTVSPTATTTYYAESGVNGSTNFSYTGGTQSFTVPASVTQLTVDATGGKGGTGTTGTGGNGGRIQTVISVTPGQVLTIYVGGAGGNLNNIAGYNGGANSLGSYPSNVGGGGGASDIRIGGVALANRVVVAGGGGGGGYNGCTENGGAGGGLIGAAGNMGCATIMAPGGGSQVAGGVAGSYGSGYLAASPGTLGFGGQGASGTGGAGGGGGYYGGGGGSWQGGGGGSSYSSGLGTIHTQGYQAGNGYVNISYQGCTSLSRTPITVTVNPLPVIAVNSGSVCLGNSFTIIPSGASTYTFSGGSAIVTPTVNTSYSVTGTSSLGCVGSNTAVSSVTINALPIPTITVNSGAICIGNSFTITPGGASTYTYSSGSAIVTPTTNITYTVTGTSSVGCTSSTGAVSSVTVNTLPTVTVNSGAICSGNSFTMSPSGASTYSYSTGSSVVNPTMTSTYTVTGTNSVTTCSNTAVSTVTVNANPSVSASTSNSIICSGESAVLTASTSATSYTWNTGATTMSVSVSPTVTSTYTVNVSNATACVSSSTVMVAVNACVGINEAVANLISVYPNPNNGVVSINLTAELAKNASLEVYDALGKLVVKQVLSNELNTINMSNLDNGIYTFKVLNNTNTIKIGKLIKN